MRGGVIRCPIWGDLGIDGSFEILIHYHRSAAGDPVFTAAYSRYNGVISDISQKMRTIKLVPDWRTQVPYAKV